jgi:Uma2 family endonuclease
MGALEKTNYISPEEYLLSENKRPDDGIKYEYTNGQMYLMAGASRGHNRASMNLQFCYTNILKGRTVMSFNRT